MERLEELPGLCPICECPTTFKATGPWLRETLLCDPCPKQMGRSVPRERALALVLKTLRPNWRDLAIHESSPARRGASEMLRRECRQYVASQYLPDQPRGQMIGGWRNEDLEAQSFPDAAFDVVVSLDVMEHVFDPARAFREIYRTLKPGGLKICTFPLYKHQADALDKRAEVRAGQVVHLAEPEYHGNPVSARGSLVTYHYGYDIHAQIAAWAPFDVSVVRLANRTAGILGEMTEVIVCEKPLRP